MFEVNPKSFADSRIQLHWASQLLSAAADAKMEKTEDDSHSNLGWDANRKELVGRAGCNIDVANLRLIYHEHSLELTGSTLPQATHWLAGRLRADIELRDYDMPSHAVANGAPFTAEPAHLLAIAEWLTLGQNTFADQNELRVWPHHFDMGFWFPGTVSGRSIGGGLSLGDQHYAQPYFYLNPYGIDRPDELPRLSRGRWTPHWFGAVLIAEELDGLNQPAVAAAQFAAETLRICHGLIGDEIAG